jgi:hypothetical protein
MSYRNTAPQPIRPPPKERPQDPKRSAAQVEFGNPNYNADRGDSKRPPPAYQEYAATMLADRGFRSMSAAERGVLFTMRLECWVNGSVPADPTSLARVLGIEVAEVKRALTPRVLRHFDEAMHDEERVLVCPQLDDYRRQLEERQSRMSAGGRRGAVHTNQARRDRPKAGHPDDYPDALPDGPPDGPPDGVLSIDKTSTAKTRTASLERDDAFVAALEGPASFEIGGGRGSG